MVKRILARETCELDCTNEYVDCVVECVGDSDCISQCMRQTVACEEVCPCHDDCFDGCPCEPRSEYCLACKDEYRDEYFYCEDQCSFRFINCTDTCKGPTDTECYDRCHNQFVEERKNCPCMENCKGIQNVQCKIYLNFILKLAALVRITNANYR